MKLIVGCMYFLKDEFFLRYKGNRLLENKAETKDGKHRRPYYFVFRDESSGIYWAVPASSRVDKYKAFEKRSIERYGRCDTIKFANVFGEERAFLVQNMCPVTEQYVDEAYIDKKTNVPVRLDGKQSRDIIQSAKRVHQKAVHGKQILFADVFAMRKSLLDDIKENKSAESV